MDRLNKFTRQERLRSKKAIGMLFKDGESFFLHPFTIIWHRAGDDLPEPARIAISVPKKNFKRAVDRNRIKRITREAWRIKKGSLYKILEQHNIHLVIMLVYIGRELPSYDDMVKKIEKLVLKFSEIINNTKTGNSKAPGL